MDLSVYAAALSVLHDTPVLRFVKNTQASEYVGDTYAWQAVGTLLCGCYPVTDQQSIELYGPRVSQMFRLHFAPGTVISDGNGIAFDTAATAPTHKVVGVQQHGTHTLAVIEVIGIGD